ncbi:hypothetical protein LIER_25308 [Lithospermum erythrorhizon]|uniref:Reverse transcriptase domain-containing protein n=1 Tax=Lithospermum erythrorhizon TaxID=34254 RepID=A0AAV3R7H4_LITER
MTWKQYRPISMCTFANKIITKLLNSRLAALLPKIISDFQTGFVKGRLIQDNILLSQELVHHIDKGTVGKFGFVEEWIARNMACVDNCWYSVMLNGELQGYFTSSKGLRQGDPSSCHSLLLVPCLALTDDCLLFYNGLQSSLKKITGFLDQFQSLSGQTVNKEKSFCIMSTKIQLSRVNIILKAIFFKKEKLPFQYLGIPILKGKNNAFSLMVYQIE